MFEITIITVLYVLSFLIINHIKNNEIDSKINTIIKLENKVTNIKNDLTAEQQMNKIAIDSKNQQIQKLKQDIQHLRKAHQAELNEARNKFLDSLYWEDSIETRIKARLVDVKDVRWRMYQVSRESWVSYATIYDYAKWENKKMTNDVINKLQEYFNIK